MSQDLMLPNEAAALLRTPASTLQWWRTMGRGPKFLKVGRRVLYRRRDLEDFLQRGEREPEAA